MVMALVLQIFRILPVDVMSFCFIALFCLIVSYMFHGFPFHPRRPHLPGNKPRPPVPKKPPVAHKPAPANHGSTAQVNTPPSLPNNHNSDSTSPTASARLSPTSHPDTVTQGAAPSTVTQNAGKAM